MTFIASTSPIPSLSDQGKAPAPAFHTFTGTEFTTPDAMHGALWLAVTGGKDIEEGIDVEKKLSSKLKYRQKTPTATSPMLVVVLDEIDQLMTQNRQVLRKLFEWADAPKSRLVSKNTPVRACFLVTVSFQCLHSLLKERFAKLSGAMLARRFSTLPTSAAALVGRRIPTS